MSLMHWLTLLGLALTILVVMEMQGRASVVVVRPHHHADDPLSCLRTVLAAASEPCGRLRAMRPFTRLPRPTLPESASSAEVPSTERYMPAIRSFGDRGC
jgi:hypothetical protein